MLGEQRLVRGQSYMGFIMLAWPLMEEEVSPRIWLENHFCSFLVSSLEIFSHKNNKNKIKIKQNK